MTTEIVTINKFQEIGDSLVISMTSEITEIQKKLENQYQVSNIPEDLSIKKNYELVKCAIQDIKKPRIALEKNRKSISSVPFQLCKKINLAAKPISEALTSLESAWKDKKVEYDDEVEQVKFEKAKAENERIEKILAKIEEIKLSPIVNMEKPANELQYILDGIKAGAEIVDEWAMELADTAQDTIAATTDRLETLIAAKKSQEEAERLQEEAAAKLKADNEAAEKKAQAEREAQDLKNKEDADRLAKEQAKLDDAKEKFRKEQEAKEAAAKKIEDERLAKIKKEDGERAAKIKAEDDAAKEKEDARLAAIKKEEDDKAAKLRAEQDKKDADAKAKADKEEADKKILLDEKNKNSRIKAAVDKLYVILESGGNPENIVEAIINGKVPNVTFT